MAALPRGWNTKSSSCWLAGRFSLQLNKQPPPRPTQDAPSDRSADRNRYQPQKDCRNIENERGHCRSVVANTVDTIPGCEFQLVQRRPVKTKHLRLRLCM